jgi:hypothetical protein
MNKSFNHLCTPAKIYFVLTIIGCIFMLFHNANLLAIFSKLIFAFIWTVILNWMCSKGYKMVSWILVLLPFILMALAFLGIYHLKKNNKENK